MTHRAILMGATTMLFVLGTNARADQLIPNWDFEILAVDEEGGQPILDSEGNEVPASWFRDVNVTDGIPHTELISPNNMNNAAGDNTEDDSTGSGTNSVALNAVTLEIAPGLRIGIPTDWRSPGVATTPGETLIFSFDFKFVGVANQDPIGSDEGFMAQIRSFADVEEGGSTAGSFQGEISPTMFAQDYANDEWHHISFQFNVPAGGNYTDVRLSANIFPPATLSTGQVLLDKVGVHRLTADFDANIVVDGQDFEIWETNFGFASDATKELGDADGDGTVDGFDFLAWQQEFGVGVGAFPQTSVAAISQVPEISSVILVLCGALGMLCGRRASVSHLRRVVKQEAPARNPGVGLRNYTRTQVFGKWPT